MEELERLRQYLDESDRLCRSLQQMLRENNEEITQCVGEEIVAAYRPVMEEATEQVAAAGHRIQELLQCTNLAL